MKTKDFPEEIFEEAFSHEFGQTTAVFDAALSCCAPGAYKRRSQTGPATAQDGPREIQNTELKCKILSIINTSIKILSILSINYKQTKTTNTMETKYKIYEQR